MRHNNSSSSSRGRGKSRNNNGGNRPRGNVPPRMQVFDSNGPDVRIRGTAWQVHEKYLALAKDANSSGDLIMTENYLQHAEHYQRIIDTFAESQPVVQDKQWTPKESGNNDKPAEAGNEAVNADSPNRDDDLALPATLFKKNGVTSEEETLQSA